MLDDITLLPSCSSLPTGWVVSVIQSGAVALVPSASHRPPCLSWESACSLLHYVTRVMSSRTTGGTILTGDTPRVGNV